MRYGTAYLTDFQVQSTLEQAGTYYRDPIKRATLVDYLTREFGQLDIGVKPDDIKIDEADDKVTLSLDWEKTVVIIPENPVVPPLSQVIKFHDVAVQKLH